MATIASEVSDKTPSAAAGGVRLPLRLKLGFGIGDLGFNLFFTTASLYLLYYYTDVLGLSPATGGWIFAVAMIWDAVTDPAMGYIANRTRSRWGRYRPYLLFGCVPLGLSFAAMFWPTRLEGATLVGFTLATHMLFRTAYTVLSMPYSSLMAAMTSDSQERGSLAAFRMVSATAGGLFVAFSTLKLVEALGEGDPLRGFFLRPVLYAVAAVALFLTTFATTAEAAPQAAHEPVLTPRAAATMLVRNRAFLIVCAYTILAMAGGTFLSKTLPYYFKYVLGREDLIGLALTALAGMVFVAVPVWARLMRRIAKRNIALSGAAVSLSALLVLSLAPAPSIEFTMALLLVIGFGNAAGFLSFWAMLPDTVEYGEWRAGVRAEGVIFGLVSFAQKAGLAIAVGILGQLLEAIGYVANRPQSPETLAGLTQLMTYGPIALGVAAASILLFYPLDRRTHGRLVRLLDRRRARSARHPPQ
jgi:glycoside/pentoside/hexuronide:cation symporter, GPH family